MTSKKIIKNLNNEEFLALTTLLKSNILSGFNLLWTHPNNPINNDHVDFIYNHDEQTLYTGGFPITTDEIVSTWDDYTNIELI